MVAMVQLFGSGSAGEIVNGGHTNITLGWGLAVTLGVAVSGRVSGAHLNPAVTLSVAIFRGFAWSKVVPYMIAQTAGAFAGAALVFLNYRPAFLKQDPMLDHTAGIFCTFPAFPEVTPLEVMAFVALPEATCQRSTPSTVPPSSRVSNVS